MDNLYSIGGETGNAQDALQPEPMTIDVTPDLPSGSTSPAGAVANLARAELGKAYAEAQASAELAEFYRGRIRLYAGGALVVGFLAGWFLMDRG